MSWVIVAGIALGASTLVSVDAQRKAGKQEEINLKEQAEQERLAAQSRELQRRQRLNKVLAANAVEMAAAGITTEGTPESLALESARQASASEGLESLSQRLKEAQLIRQGRSARSQANIASVSTLLSGAGQIAALGGFGGSED